MNPSPILVDCCALADLFVGKAPFRDAAESLRRNRPHWRADPLIVYEFANVLRTQVKAGRMVEAQALQFLSAGLGLLDISEGTEPDDVLQLALRKQLTFYDAAHVATAIKLGIPLFTRDKEILANCPEVACPIPNTEP
jgi:predicted nucleic acid-binding protein